MSIASATCIASPKAPPREGERHAYSRMRLERRIVMAREGIVMVNGGLQRAPHWTFLARTLLASMPARGAKDKLLTCSQYEDLQDIIALWQREIRATFLVTPSGLHQTQHARAYLASLLRGDA